MSFSSGTNTLSLDEVLQLVSEEEIAHYYLGIDEIPCVINSPLRTDVKPSFAIYSLDGKGIRYRDFATGERGNIFDILSQMWHLPFSKVLTKIINDLVNINKKNVRHSLTQIKTLSASGLIKKREHSEIKVKIREWRKYDIDYWKSYGISLDWLKMANVYPISHKLILKGGKTYTFGADKYAYAYIERKEGKVSIKVYQPYNKNGFKWCTSTDSSVISLWTKVPENGDKICICASLKDALCLWANTEIPALAIQGEGYLMSQTAINELNRRFKHVYILLDNDEAGLIDGEKLSKITGFTNLVLPTFEGGKDISDLYHTLKNKQLFQKVILPLFNN